MEGFDPSLLLMPSGRMTLGWLVVVGVMQVIISFIATLLLYPFPVLSVTLDLTACVFGVNDIL
jgi:hypothetical protein